VFHADMVGARRKSVKSEGDAALDDYAFRCMNETPGAGRLRLEESAE
jgi:hypothetical protein